MDENNMIDIIDLPTSENSETMNSQLNTTDVKKSEEIEVLVTQENLKLNVEPLSIEEPEKLKFEDTVMTVNDELAQQNLLVEPTSDQLISTAGILTEYIDSSPKTLIQQTQDGPKNLIEGQHQVIPVIESDPNNVVKVENSGVDLDQQLVLNMNDTELKDLVMKELSEFLIEGSSHNGPSLLNADSNYIQNDEIIQTESLENKTDQKETTNSVNNFADPLSTLATAALNQASTSKDVNSEIAKPNQAVLHVKQEKPIWHDVGVIKGNSCAVKQFYSTSITDEHENTTLDHLPDYTNKLKIDIEPGTAYKFRIAAINASGRGEWSEVSAFKTCLPGYPDAPSAIKIIKVTDGVSLKWEEPPSNSGKIIEYTVCMAIKNPKEKGAQRSKQPSTNLYFVRVYTGPCNSVVVSDESLGAALIDKTVKPAIIFRIAAKNEKGYGPATQVRWLQDTNMSPESSKNSSAKRNKNVMKRRGKGSKRH